MAADTKFLGMDSSQIPMFSALMAMLAISLTTFVFALMTYISINANTNAVRADGVAFREEIARDIAIRAATAELRAEMVANDIAFRKEMNALRLEMIANENATRAEFNARINALNAELREVKTETIRTNNRLDSIERRLDRLETRAVR